MGKTLFTAMMALVSISTASAYESEDSFGYIDAQVLQSKPLELEKKKLPMDGTRIRKFNLALDSLDRPVPRETPLDAADFPRDYTVTAPTAARLKMIDPQGGLTRYLKKDATAMSMYQDFFSALLPASFLDLTINYKSATPTEDSAELVNRLRTIANNDSAKPLKGLRVVIDPGHMGTPEWDKKGGKFVSVNGVYVSEGKLNLWTAYLVSNLLEDLGATVALTHTQEGPASLSDENNFETKPYINQYFYNSLDSWMANYLSLSDTALQASINDKPEVKKAYTAAQKLQFFIGGEDLEARSLIVDREKPDVVLDIHYDANKTDQLSTGIKNSLEAFVPGAFLTGETGSRKIRGLALKHLLETRRWDESVNLATEITQSMSTSTGIALWDVESFNSPDISVMKVKNGVYARNLYINRRVKSSLMVYLECLHYDDPKEFSGLSKNTEAASYHGVRFNYPARLNAIAGGIKTGFVNYFRKMPKR